MKVPQVDLRKTKQAQGGDRIDQRRPLIVALVTLTAADRVSEDVVHVALLLFVFHDVGETRPRLVPKRMRSDTRAVNADRLAVLDKPSRDPRSALPILALGCNVRKQRVVGRRSLLIA